MNLQLQLQSEASECGLACLAMISRYHGFLRSAAVDVLAATKFKPARCGGQPCAMDFPFVIELKGGGSRW